jgi:DNA-binding transcriptional MerR regulator
MEFSNAPSLFDDGKAPDALRTIGEVAKALDIRQHVLRYWEEQFPMLHPVKRSGRRYYRPEDVALIARIDRMVHKEGFTLRGARMAIEGEGTGPRIEAKATPGFSVEALSGIRDRLARALAAA